MTSRNNLDFAWDKEQQDFIEQQERKKVSKDEVRDVEDYFRFLEEIDPGVLPKKEKLADKQFTL